METCCKGDTLTVIENMKIKGSSSVVKVGTKIKNIRLVDADHVIDCKIERIGLMSVKSEFVKATWILGAGQEYQQRMELRKEPRDDLRAERWT